MQQVFNHYFSRVGCGAVAFSIGLDVDIIRLKQLSTEGE